MIKFVVIENSITNLAIPGDETNLGLLRAMLNAGVVSSHDQLSTAFMAAKNGALDVLRLLVEHGLPLDASGTYRCPAEVGPESNRVPSHRPRDILEMAVIGGHTEVVKYLLQTERRNDAEVLNKTVALAETASRGHMWIASEIISNELGFLLGLNLGNALYEAAYRGHTDVVELFSFWFKEIIPQVDWNDACFCAMAQKHSDAHELLLSAGAEPVQSSKRALGGNTRINNLGRPERIETSRAPTLS